MSDSSLKRRTISGMLWVGIQKFGTLGITFISNIFLARMLTPDDYGLVGMLAIFIAISNSFIDAGLGSALIQKTKPTQTDYTTVFYWNILFSIFLYCIIFFVAPWIEEFYGNIYGLSKILRIQGIVIIINALTIVQFNQLRKRMRFKELARINISSAVVSVIIAIISALYGLGVWSLVIQQISLSLCNVVLLWWFIRWKPTGHISFKSLRGLFGFGFYLMCAGLLNTISNNLNGVLIGKFFSATTLGYFTQAKKLEDVSSLGILNVVEQVTYPVLVEVKEDYIRMANILKNFNIILLFFVMPLLYSIAIMAKPIIVVLYSDKWLASAPMLQILAIAGIFVCMQGSSYNAIAAIGKSKVLFNWTIIKRTTNCIILVALLLIFGFKGLLWGLVMSALFILLCNMYLVAKYIGYGFCQQIVDLLPTILLTTCPFLLILLIKNYIKPPFNFMVNDTIFGFAYLSIYLLIVYIFPLKQVSMVKNEVLMYRKTKIDNQN